MLTNLALLAALAAPAPARAADAASLRRALVHELRSQKDDPIGRAAADFLETSTTALRVAPTHPDRDGAVPAAEYEADRRVITVDDRLLASAEGARDLRLAAERLAPTLVHELEHARADAAVPGAPLMREGEFCAYAAEAAFLRRRLAGDPEYAGLAEVDERAPRSHPRGRPSRWWLDPLPPGDPVSLVAPADAQRTRTNYWLVARASAGGLEALERLLLDLKWVDLPDAKKACSPALDDARRRACGRAAKRYRARLRELGALLGSRNW